EEGHRVKSAKKLPGNLLDALRQLDRNKEMRAGLGDELINAYIKLKLDEWTSYMGSLSDWERANTLDC
ncbi:MAG: glutamine synthetase, partial [Gammaproteobacteria bacterium]|nr:glutamine synthetase [Gammaproteobacteria bacterium]